MQAEDKAPPPSGQGPRARRYTHFLFRAPTSAQSVGLILLVNLVLAALLWFPGGGTGLLLEGYLLVFLVPALVAGLLTGPLATAFGGRLELHRSLLVALTVGGISAPIVIVWRLVEAFLPAWLPSLAAALLFLQGPSIWFRHMSLFGLSNPSHARSLPPSLLQPLLSTLGIFVLYRPTVSLVAAAGLFLLLGFLCAALLLRAADRPLRREFGSSGVSMIRPLLDHINERDPSATRTLEAFFSRFAIPANLRVTLVSFWQGGQPKATIALPTVHPGPFAALGASDLPRKLAERLGTSAGIVFVPHTPCDHDLDLPTSTEIDRVGSVARQLLSDLTEFPVTRASPYVTPYDGSFAAAQMLEDLALVVVSQAPAPTDDIAFSVADRIVRKYREDGSGLTLALIDAHNSYVEDQGDITYGTPAAEKLVRDVDAAIAKARSQAKPGTLEVGVAFKDGYKIGVHGIGPHGIRALVVRAAGTTTAYVLIDGNNLLLGLRAVILRALRPMVDAAEVMTTDNHVVHEVDGGINPVGERYGVDSLTRDVREVVGRALGNLGPAQLRAGSREAPGVSVLGPTFTARLLTSLGDTLSMFTNALLTTFLLLIGSSLVLLLALR